MRCICLLVLACLVGLSAAGQSAFTYQGRLLQDGVAYEGTIDIRAQLFDDERSGSVVGSVSSAQAVSVTDGVFSVELDFGPGGFVEGQPRWLEIEVAVEGGGGFEQFGRRQRILPVPLAQRAATAGVADVALVALNGPSGGPGSGVVPSSSGLPMGSTVAVTLSGRNQRGDDLVVVPLALRGEVGTWFELEPTFELYRLWTPDSDWERFFDEPPQAGGLTLTVEVRVVAAGREEGRVTYEFDGVFPDDRPELLIGANGGLLQRVVMRQPDDEPERFEDGDGEVAVVRPSLRIEPNSVPGTPGRVEVVFNRFQSMAFSETVEELASPGRPISLVRSVAGATSSFNFATSCLEPSGPNCGEATVRFDDGVVRTDLDTLGDDNQDLRFAGWSLRMMDDGLPAEVYRWGETFFRR